jgi:hypothetical protein
MAGAAELPDLVPVGLRNRLVTTRFCGGTPTLEFDILTANIGGQDWTRPLRPSGGFRMPQIYEYIMYNYQQVGTDKLGEPIFDFVQIDIRRKTTICTIDSSVAYPCIREHGGMFTCSSFPRQGISRGYADSYYRGLTGQYSCIMGNTGYFLLRAHLDPDYELADDGILPAQSIDATHDNNFADAYFYWDGATFTLDTVALYFDPDGVCPP